MVKCLFGWWIMTDQRAESMVPESAVMPRAVPQKDYAKLRGISEAMVSKYKSGGRLVLDEQGFVLIKETDQLLSRTLDPLHGGDRSGKSSGREKITYLEAKTEEARARATKATLEAEIMSGTLVRTAEVEAEAFARARGAQEVLMAIPDRIAPLLAAESDVGKIHALLSDELRRVCEAIAGEQS